MSARQRLRELRGPHPGAETMNALPLTYMVRSAVPAHRNGHASEVTATGDDAALLVAARAYRDRTGEPGPYYAEAFDAEGHLCKRALIEGGLEGGTVTWGVPPP